MQSVYLLISRIVISYNKSIERRVEKCMLTKKKIVALFVVIMMFALGINTMAVTRDISLNGTGIDLEQRTLSAGSRRGRVAVNSISNSPSSVTPQLYMGIGGTGFTVVSRTFTSAGSSVRWYNLAGVTTLKASADGLSSGTVTANVSWSFDY